MAFEPAKSSKSQRRWLGLARLSIVIVGIVIAQFILYGTALVGRTILLPLDILAERSAVGEANREPVQPHDRLLTDPIFQFELMRRFAVSEVRAGRLPLWDPRNYSGAPFLANNQSAVFSPFRLLDYLWPSPVALAWGQMLKALVGGVGAYIFFRRALRCRFIAAAIGAWIWPLSGFLVNWTMWPQSATALWLPWVLLAVRQTIRRPSDRWIALLAMLTCFTLICGHSATGAQVLLASGIYAIWLVISRRAGIRSVLMVALGWLLGIGLAAPQIIPTLDYLRDSLRMAQRLQNGTDIKPVGLSALPQIVMPWIDGSTRAGWIYLNSDNPLESAINGYVGLIAVFVLAPWGFIDPRKRREQWFWIALAILAAAYVLDLPGAFALHRLPVLSSLNGNRFIFISGFALLAASVSGLDAMSGSQWASRSGWLLAAPVLALVAATWCVWRITILPELINARVNQATQPSWAIQQLLDRFQTMHFAYAGVCIVAAMMSGILFLRPKRGLAVLVGLAAVAEVLINAYPVNPRCDAELYDWNLPVFKALAVAEPGRICGVRCLPPMLNQWAGLSDIRGYDGVDPNRYIEFLQLFADPKSPPPSSLKATSDFVPRMPSPLADFVGLRYEIYQGQPWPEANPLITTPGYFVIENRSALPRVSVPKHATILADKTARLKALSDSSFDPRETVIVESDPGISTSADVIGDAHIVSELPSRIEIEYTMQTPGLIVLADEWDAGWHATVNGKETPVLRANHAFRAVAVPQGAGELIFTYNPASFRIGLWIAVIAVIGCITLCFDELIHPHIRRAVQTFRRS